MAGNDTPGGNTQMITVGQNVVVALGEITKAINSTFPNWVTPPANSTASGVSGQVAFAGGGSTTGYFYLCLVGGAAGTANWGRATLTTSF